MIVVVSTHMLSNQKMPTGVYILRFEENQFRPEVSEKYIDSYVWMDFLMKEQKIKIMQKLYNFKEIRIRNYCQTCV